MTRDQREHELERMTVIDTEKFLAIYRKAAGVPDNSTVPLGLPVKRMIQLILDYEFAPGGKQGRK